VSQRERNKLAETTLRGCHRSGHGDQFVTSLSPSFDRSSKYEPANTTNQAMLPPAAVNAYIQRLHQQISYSHTHHEPGGGTHQRRLMSDPRTGRFSTTQELSHTVLYVFRMICELRTYSSKDPVHKLMVAHMIKEFPPPIMESVFKSLPLDMTHTDDSSPRPMSFHTYFHY
jgi:hypothetical protein